jgi:RNA polymerase sigma factor (sigma-70 family)
MGMDLKPKPQPATDDARRERIRRLIFGAADETVRKVLRQRLRLLPSAAKFDTEDIYQTTVLKLVQSLTAQPPDSPLWGAEDFRSYAAKVAHNVCNDYLRRRLPERHRLKEQVRYVLDRHPDFASWLDANRLLCGFARWAGRRASGRAARRLAALAADPRELATPAGARLGQSPSPKLIAEIFTRTGGPVETDALINLVAAVLGVKDRDEEPPPASARRNDASVRHFDDPLEADAALRRLWEALRTLPPQQRVAFALTGQSVGGESLLHLLLCRGIVTPSAICEAVEVSRERLLILWDKLPLEAGVAAAEMNTTRQNVAKLRHRALKRLAAEFGV